MDFGLLIFATDTIAPDTLAREERRTFESLFAEHISASRKSPWPGGAELPRQWHAHDPFVALSMAAAVTKTIKLGTGISLVTERDPTMAKQVASLDFLSTGEYSLAGAGWNAEEMENHGTPFADRWKILRERVLAMREIWTVKRPNITANLTLTNCTPNRFSRGHRCCLALLLGFIPTYCRIRRWLVPNLSRRASLTPAEVSLQRVLRTREAWDAAGCDGTKF